MKELEELHNTLDEVSDENEEKVISMLVLFLFLIFFSNGLNAFNSVLTLLLP